jgi:hypothetical protein
VRGTARGLGASLCWQLVSGDGVPGSCSPALCTAGHMRSPPPTALRLASAALQLLLPGSCGVAIGQGLVPLRLSAAGRDATRWRIAWTSWDAGCGLVGPTPGATGPLHIRRRDRPQHSVALVTLPPTPAPLRSQQLLRLHLHTQVSGEAPLLRGRATS